MKITNESVHAALDEALSGVSLSEFDRQRIVYNARNAVQRRRRPLLRRACMLAATFALASALALGALAVPDLAEKLGMLSYRTLSYLRPVEKQCVRDDISVEVTAAMNDGDTAVIYVSVKDLSGQNRLDGSLDTGGMLLDGMNMTSIDNTYVKEDGTVVLRMVAQSDAADLSGKKIRLNFDSLIAGAAYQSMQDTGYTVADILTQNPRPELAGYLPASSFTVNGDTNGKLYPLLDGGHLQALSPAAQFSDGALAWDPVRNAGVIDGLLHILTEPDPQQAYNSAEYVLGDAAGNPYDAETANVTYGELEQKTDNPWSNGMRWNERILELPDGVDPADMHIYRNVSTFGTCVDENWDVSFTLQEVTPAASAACSLDMGSWNMTAITVSPIGVTLSGSGELSEDMDSPQIDVILADGTDVHEDSSWMSSMSMISESGEMLEQGQILHKYLFEEPLVQDDIAAVKVDGHTVWQKGTAAA